MKPRVGFLGAGWIGRHRLQAIAGTGQVEVAALCDPSPECVAAAAEIAPHAREVRSFEELLDCGLDAIVIATPSAMHAEQSIRAFERGLAVFCQKPLGRDAAEVEAVVDAARRADRLLGIDLSYRHAEGMRKIGEVMRAGSLGQLFAIDLTFHNAYGPDKDWFYDRAQSGGGCLIDLGIHLVDLALWTLGFPDVENVDAALFVAGQPARRDQVEDYAVASFRAGSVQVRLACSWRLNAGQDAVIEAAFYGTQGGAALRNLQGSFTALGAEHFRGTHSERLADGTDEWGGCAAAEWACRLAANPSYDAEAAEYIASAAVLDRIYASGLVMTQTTEGAVGVPA